AGQGAIRVQEPGAEADRTWAGEGQGQGQAGFGTGDEAGRTDDRAAEGCRQRLRDARLGLALSPRAARQEDPRSRMTVVAARPAPRRCRAAIAAQEANAHQTRA